MFQFSFELLIASTCQTPVTSTAVFNFFYLMEHLEGTKILTDKAHCTAGHWFPYPVPVPLTHGTPEDCSD